MKTRLSGAGWWSVLSPYRMLIIWAVCYYLAAGRLNIVRSWVVLGIMFIGCLVATFFQLKYLPELSNARGKAQKGTKSWDLILLLIYFLAYLFGNSIVAGLDTGRYGWSSFGWSFMIIGTALYALTFIIIQWAMLKNKHFEGTVRIQKDRAHLVVDDGPYGYVRHPGYVGMILINIAVPFMIGSAMAFIPASLCMLVVVIRTALEDRTLQNELSGYKEYASRIRYRLVPGVW